jgi:hypothetical protein
MDPYTLTAEFARRIGDRKSGNALSVIVDWLVPGGMLIDEDPPFLLDKDQAKDHVAFHAAGLWTQREWAFRVARFDVFGSTGLISAAFTLRGKPVDSGFRLRHGLLTISCAWRNGERQALVANFGPLSGHIVDASPN